MRSLENMLLLMLWLGLPCTDDLQPDPHPKPDGAALYAEHCAVCHMPTGDGVPFMQPALFDAPRANAKPGGVIDMILWGSKAVPPGTSEYDNQMPGFEFLSDTDIAALASYVRTHFDNTGGPVGAELVAQRRRHSPAQN